MRLAFWKNQALAGMTAAEILGPANNALARITIPACLAFVGILDLKSGLLSYANAGHNPPLLQKRGGPILSCP